MCECVLCQKHITSKRLTSPYLFGARLGFFSQRRLQSEARKVSLLKYGIREFKVKNLERLYMYVCDRKKSFCGIKDKVTMLL